MQDKKYQFQGEKNVKNEIQIKLSFKTSDISFVHEPRPSAWQQYPFGPQ